MIACAATPEGLQVAMAFAGALGFGMAWVVQAWRHRRRKVRVAREYEIGV